MNEKLKIVFVIELCVLFFLGGFITGKRIGGRSSNIDARLSAALADNDRLTAELGGARGRIADLECGLNDIRDTAGRFGDINTGFEAGIGDLKNSIQQGSDANQNLTGEHRTSGELISRLAGILEQYSAPGGGP